MLARHLHLTAESVGAKGNNAAVTTGEGEIGGGLVALQVKEESDVVADADAEEGTTAVTTAEGDIEVETKVKAPKPRLPKANNRLTVRLLAAARHALAHPESGVRVLRFVVRILVPGCSWRLRLAPETSAASCMKLCSSAIRAPLVSNASQAGHCSFA